jgi:hypothetical protein
MKRTRVLIVSILAISMIAIPFSHAAAEIQPIDISGIWVSREPGQGLNQTTVPHFQLSVTTFYDVRLELNQSDETTLGVLTLSDGENVTVYAANGTILGSVFTMTSFRTYLVEGYIRNVTVVCDLEINRESMVGEGLLYVGGLSFPDAFWKLDLVREVEPDITPLGMTIAIVIGLAVLIAIREMREKWR